MRRLSTTSLGLCCWFLAAVTIELHLRALGGAFAAASIGYFAAAAIKKARQQRKESK